MLCSSKVFSETVTGSLLTLVERRLLLSLHLLIINLHMIPSVCGII